MKKSKLMILTLMLLFCATIFLSACDQEVILEKDGETTIVTNSKKKVSECSDDVNTAAYILAGNLQSVATYQIDVTGTVEANKGFIHYVQNVENLIIKNGNETYTKSVSESDIVSSEHEAFVKDNKVVFRNSLDGDYRVVTLSDYLNVYGVVPTDNIFGYVFNEDTITASELTEVDGNYKLSYTLDNALSTTFVARQTKEFGNLNTYPTFSSVKFEITLTNDWELIEIKTNIVYSISIAILGNCDCEQNLTYSFSNYNETVEIPNSEELNSEIGSTPTIITPVEDTEETPFSVLLDAITQLDLQTGIIASGSLKATVEGTSLSLPVKLELKVSDTLDFTAEKAIELRVSAELFTEKIEIYYCNDNKLYLTLGEETTYISLGSNTDESEVSVLDVLSEIFTVTTTDEKLFTISLNVEKVNELIASEEFTLSEVNIYANVSNGRIATIDISVKTNLLDASGELCVVEKAFVSPDVTSAQPLSFEWLVTGSVSISGSPVPLPLINIIANVGDGISLVVDMDLTYQASGEFWGDLAGSIVPMAFPTANSDLLSAFINKELERLVIEYKGDDQIVLSGYEKADEEATYVETINLAASEEDTPEEESAITLPTTEELIQAIVNGFMITKDGLHLDLTDIVAPLYESLIGQIGNVIPDNGDGMKDFALYMIFAMIPEKLGNASIDVTVLESGNPHVSIVLSGALVDQNGTTYTDFVQIQIMKPSDFVVETEDETPTE